MSEPIRLVLTPEQSAVIRESGFQFMAGSPVSLAPTRATLVLIECNQEQANAAVRVARGITSERKPKTGPKNSPFKTHCRNPSHETAAS